MRCLYHTRHLLQSGWTGLDWTRLDWTDLRRSTSVIQLNVPYMIVIVHHTLFCARAPQSNFTQCQ